MTERFDWNTWYDLPAAMKVKTWDSMLWKAESFNFESMTITEKNLLVSRINDEDCFCDGCEERYSSMMVSTFDEDMDSEIAEKCGADDYETWCVWCIAEAVAPKCKNCGTSDPNKEECKRYIDSDWVHFEGHDFPSGDDAQ
jgi:hypothetical protein